MPFSRSTQPFFYQSGVSETVERLASQDSLVIYAGAGVSIDRTGLSWAGLVDALLKPHMEQYDDDRDGLQRAAIMHANTPVQAASVVSEKYAAHSGEEWRAEVVDRLRTLLYVTRYWQRGELISAIVRLAAAFSALDRKFYIVTTNYDEFVQREVEKLVQSNGIELNLATSVVDHSRQDEDFLAHTAPYQVVHLHGHVPKSGSNGSQDIILSETDYMRSQPLSSKILKALFDKRSVLILGSSLTDQPLLEALAATRSTKPGAPPRVAVTALQSLDLPGDTDKIIDVVQDSIRLRMRQFDTEVVFPDFYCQIPQLLNELVVRATSASTPVGYARRIEKWWSAWWRIRWVQQRQVQQFDHEYLERCLPRIRQILGSTDEVLKLETWIRWEPGRQSRQLRLWASSTGTAPDIKTMRCAEIEANSPNASVRAFCLGRPEIYPTSGDDSAGLLSDRWQTYLCVPVRIVADGGELPIAVVSLGTMNPKAKSKINEGNGAALQQVVGQMLEIGQNVATVDRTGR
ncbi:MAG TPA: SIR2 family protein [Pseudonocardiaceae bacterium]